MTALDLFQIIFLVLVFIIGAGGMAYVLFSNKDNTQE